MLDKRTRGRVLGLRVRCNKDGCDWEGELGDLEKHLSKKCLYVEEVCPHGCGQSFPRHLLQTHQQDECPQRPLDVQLGSLKRQLSQKYSIYEQLQQKLMELEKKHNKDKKELQQQLLEQEKKHNEDKELQQQLMEQRQQLAQQEKKHEKDKKVLQEQLLEQEQQLLQQKKDHEKDVIALQQQLAQQEMKHDPDELQQLIVQQKKHESQLMEITSKEKVNLYECGRYAEVVGDVFKSIIALGSGQLIGAVMVLEAMSPKLNYFEYEIVDNGRETAISIGVGEREYPLGRMPGWEENSIGYHADDGNFTGVGSRTMNYNSWYENFKTACNAANIVGLGTSH